MALSANPAARSALWYITIGSLTCIWAGVWFWYMQSVPAGNRDGTWWYICMGLLLSGAVLIIIGLLVGRIGREARHADAPPAPAADAQSTANARAANANAATAANVTANAPSTGTPPYMVSTPVAPATPTAANPVAGPAAVPTAAPPAPGTRQHRV